MFFYEGTDTMENELLEQIDQTVLEAELQVVLAISASLDKAAMIMESATGDVDLSSFSLFQEGDESKDKDNQSVLGQIGDVIKGHFRRDKKDGKRESMIKSILLFLPRVITLFVKLAKRVVDLIRFRSKKIVKKKGCYRTIANLDKILEYSEDIAVAGKHSMKYIVSLETAERFGGKGDPLDPVCKEICDKLELKTIDDLVLKEPVDIKADELNEKLVKICDNLRIVSMGDAVDFDKITERFESVNCDGDSIMYYANMSVIKIFYMEGCKLLREVAKLMSEVGLKYIPEGEEEAEQRKQNAEEFVNNFDEEWNKHQEQDKLKDEVLGASEPDDDTINNEGWINDTDDDVVVFQESGEAAGAGGIVLMGLGVVAACSALGKINQAIDHWTSDLWARHDLGVLMRNINKVTDCINPLKGKLNVRPKKMRRRLEAMQKMINTRAMDPDRAGWYQEWFTASEIKAIKAFYEQCVLLKRVLHRYNTKRDEVGKKRLGKQLEAFLQHAEIVCNIIKDCRGKKKGVSDDESYGANVDKNIYDTGQHVKKEEIKVPDPNDDSSCWLNDDKSSSKDDE
jgi:hypothetical protein